MKVFVIASLTLVLAQGVAMAKPAASKEKAVSPIETLDADKDGKLSKDEVKADTALTGKFVEMDANKDGFLDKDEIKGAHAGKTHAAPAHPAK